MQHGEQQQQQPSQAPTSTVCAARQSGFKPMVMLLQLQLQRMPQGAQHACLCFTPVPPPPHTFLQAS